MAEFKGTPGPWTVSNRDWRGEADAHGNLYVSGDRRADEEGDYATAVCKVEGNPTAGGIPAANARLIAAAPDLLAACKLAFDVFFGTTMVSGSCNAIDALDAAIAKAGG